MVRPSRAPLVGLSVLLVLSIIGWIGFDHVMERLRAPRCTSPATVTVTAAPAIAPALTEAAAGFDSSADCYVVEVRAQDSQETVGLLSDSSAARPVVWVPDSTMWLWQARDSGAWKVPESGTSIASSPAVLAVRDGVAKSAWREVAGVANPARDPASLAALLAVRSAVQSEKDPGSALVAALRPVSASVVEQPSELFGQFDAVPTTELALRAHNSVPGGVRYTAADTAPGLDFPFVVLPDAGEAQRSGAEKFLARVRSMPGLDKAGLRAPDEKNVLPSVEVVDETLRTWAGLTLTARVLAVVDVSGSMGEIVPRTGKTRMALTVAAAERGMGLFKPATRLGLWKFSTGMDGEKDYVEVLPTSTIKEHLAGGALGKLRAIRATERGGTGLYDTTLAAYREARGKWELGRINIVVIMTDGSNEDFRSISRQQLLDELGKLQDKRRPLPIIAIGVGPQVDVDEVRSIAEATGGRAFTTVDPAGIGDVFAQALSTMLCQPPACRP